MSNQSCGGITTVRNSMHIVTTKGTCSHKPKPKQPCCIITHQPPGPQTLAIHQHCPLPVQDYTCGSQYIIQPQVLILSLPQVVQPAVQQVTVCYLYPIHLCPQHCYGLCYSHGHSGCVPIQQWPFYRCGYGGLYSGGIGGIDGNGGYIG